MSSKLTPEQMAAQMAAFTKLKSEFPFLEPGLSNNNTKHVGVRQVFNNSGRNENVARTRLMEVAKEWTEEEKRSAIAKAEKNATNAKAKNNIAAAAKKASTSTQAKKSNSSSSGRNTSATPSAVSASTTSSAVPLSLQERLERLKNPSLMGATSISATPSAVSASITPTSFEIAMRNRLKRLKNPSSISPKNMAAQSLIDSESDNPFGAPTYAQVIEILKAPTTVISLADYKPTLSKLDIVYPLTMTKEEVEETSQRIVTAIDNGKQLIDVPVGVTITITNPMASSYDPYAPNLLTTSPYLIRDPKQRELAELFQAAARLPRRGGRSRRLKSKRNKRTRRHVR